MLIGWILLVNWKGRSVGTVRLDEDCVASQDVIGAEPDFGTGGAGKGCELLQFSSTYVGRGGILIFAIGLATPIGQKDSARGLRAAYFSGDGQEGEIATLTLLQIDSS
jgi:hypothetical protein